MIRSTSLAVTTALLAASPALAETTLGSVFSDGMVVQADAPVVIWGTDDPGQKVTVYFKPGVAEATADEQGKWQVQFPPVEAAAEPTQLLVNGSTEIDIADVLIGDVWLCSGQSNMEWPLRQTAEGEQAIADAGDDRLRLLTVPRNTADEPVDTFDASWERSTSETVPEFSAVGYHFGKMLREETGRPIGLIDATWGGTPIAAWLPEDRQVEGGPSGNRPQDQPGSLYNGMTHPIGPIAVKGVIWYQGENDANRPDHWREAYVALRDAWREQFDSRDAPAYFVQLAHFYRNPPLGWAAFQDMQRRLAAESDDDGIDMAVTSDVSDARDIHPRQKRPVGERLARLALRDVYGVHIAASGPMPREATREEAGKVRVTFEHADGLKTVDGEKPKAFHLVDAEGRRHEAFATIDGDAVVLDSGEGVTAEQVAYAYEAAPVVNLVNGEGLPASPFLIDVE